MKSWLVRQPDWVISSIAGAAAFGCYFSMYAFRKPFTAATFEGLAVLGFGLKSWLVIAQVLGYAMAKFTGIKLISELGKRRRGVAIIGLILWAELALLGFGLAGPLWLKIGFLFLNGFPLGFIWGLVFSYLEGRRTTDLLGVLLASSFVFASGTVKSAGAALMKYDGFSAFWMPFWVGILFLPLLLGCVFLLEKIPPPNAADQAERTRRLPMNGPQRLAFWKKYRIGLLAVVIGYVGLTTLRDLRDNFAAELWTSLGMGNQPGIFARTEMLAAFGSLAILSAFFVVKNNRRAVNLLLGLAVVGLAGVIFSTVLFERNLLGPVAWQSWLGLGLYLAYLPFNAVFFDRLIAAARQPATAGFLIYVADSFGYLGGISILVWKNFGQKDLDWLPFMISSGYWLSALAGLSMVVGLVYFLKKW